MSDPNREDLSASELFGQFADAACELLEILKERIYYVPPELRLKAPETSAQADVRQR